MASWTEVSWLLAKCLFIGLYNDHWLYWIHRFFHADNQKVWKPLRKIQKYFWRCHQLHHRKYALILHPAEWALALILPVSLGIFLIGWPLVLLLTSWGIFEAARGHGHFLKLPWLPKRFYKIVGYAEVRYHVWHHRHQKENLGQFLWYCDWLYGTMAPRYRRQL